MTYLELCQLVHHKNDYKIEYSKHYLRISRTLINKRVGIYPNFKKLAMCVNRFS